MHLEHCTAVLDACHLRPKQNVLMVSGRAAVVHAIRPSTILFRYLDRGPDDYVEIQRHRVPELVRV